MASILVYEMVLKFQAMLNGSLLLQRTLMTADTEKGHRHSCSTDSCLGISALRLRRHFASRSVAVAMVGLAAFSVASRNKVISPGRVRGIENPETDDGTSMMRSAFDHRYQEATLSGIGGYSPRLGLLPRDIDRLSGLRRRGWSCTARSQHRNRYSRHHRTHYHHPLCYRPLLTFMKATVRFRTTAYVGRSAYM
jgi:hypothetical protein